MGIVRKQCDKRRRYVDGGSVEASVLAFAARIDAAWIV
jgi:hypothetical protein